MGQMHLFISAPLHSDEVLISTFPSSPRNPYKGVVESDHTFKLFSKMSSNSNFFNTATFRRSDKFLNRREASPLKILAVKLKKNFFSCQGLIMYLSFGAV